MTRKQENDLDTIEQGKPYIRSIVALLIYLAGRKGTVGESYKTADIFIDQMDKDVDKSFSESD